MIEEQTESKLQAEWTDDCQGKKDYDGHIIDISTRYWPRGGSALVIDTSKGTFSDNTDPGRQGIKPSAHSSIVLRDGSFYNTTLVEASFEGETEEEVKAKVETWAKQQFDELVELLRTKYTFKAD